MHRPVHLQQLQLTLVVSSNDDGNSPTAVIIHRKRQIYHSASTTVIALIDTDVRHDFEKQVVIVNGTLTSERELKTFPVSSL